jgi:hypothetical protein
MFSERCRSFAIRQDAAKGLIAIVAVPHHLTSGASDVVITMMKAWIVPRVSVKSDNAFCCVVAAGPCPSYQARLRAQYVCHYPRELDHKRPTSKVDQVPGRERYSNGVHYCRQVNDLLQDGSLKRRQVPKRSRDHADHAGHHSSHGALQGN